MCVCTVVVVTGGAGAESGHREGESGEGTEEGRGQRYSVCHVETVTHTEGDPLGGPGGDSCRLDSLGKLACLNNAFVHCV